MKLSISIADQGAVPALAALHTDVADHLTARYGRGPWSAVTTESGVSMGLRLSRVLVARDGKTIVGTLRLQGKKPWAIDPAYFTPVRKPIYLTHMAVMPKMQRQGIGRLLLDEAVKQVKEWPAQSIRLDAYDHAAGAGAFYAACGFLERGHITFRGAPLIYYELVL